MREGDQVPLIEQIELQRAASASLRFAPFFSVVIQRTPFALVCRLKSSRVNSRRGS
jgi:hypothetical protein